MNNKKPTLEQFLLKTHTRGSTDSYLHSINHFLALHPRAEKYKFKDVLEFINQQHERYDNPDSVRRILSAIKRYYQYLIEIGKRNDHPCLNFHIKGERKKDIQIQNLFSSEELELLFTRYNRYENLELRNKVILSFLVFQGLTSEEITKLDVDNVDFDEGKVYIKASQKLSRRKLDLNSRQILWLNDYLKEYRHKLIKTNSTRLIIGHRGDPETVASIERMIRPLKGLFPDRSLNPKTIRQSVIANWLNEKKYALEDVQMLAGHKWPSTTEKYRRKDLNEQRELINRFHPMG